MSKRITDAESSSWIRNGKKLLHMVHELYAYRLTTVLLIVFPCFPLLAEVMLVAVTSAVIRKYSEEYMPALPITCHHQHDFVRWSGSVGKISAGLEIPLFTAVFQAVVAIVGLILFIRLCRWIQIKNQGPD